MEVEAGWRLCAGTGRTFNATSKLVLKTYSRKNFANACVITIPELIGIALLSIVCGIVHGLLGVVFNIIVFLPEVMPLHTVQNQQVFLVLSEAKSRAS